MFNLSITRSCGHVEKISVELGNVTGKNINVAVDKLEKEESLKLCGKCQALVVELKPKVEKSYTLETVIMLIGIALFLVLLGSFGKIITFAWKSWYGY